MNTPTPPQVKVKTDEEKDAETRAGEERLRRIKLDQMLRALTEGRCSKPGTGNPYDQLSDALMSCVTDAVFGAIHSPDFAAALAARGFVVVPIVEDTRPPDPPSGWSHDAIDLIGASGDWCDPMGRIDHLYNTAWLEGFRAGQAHTLVHTPAPSRARARKPRTTTPESEQETATP